MSGGIGFDPSREWLGIDAVDLGDAFRVLGLPSDVSDPTIVAAAAAGLQAKLQAVAPGPFTIAHEALARRIDACRDEVLAAVAARGRTVAAPPPLPPPPPASAFPPPPPPWSPGLPAPVHVDPVSSSSTAIEAADIAVRTAVPRRRRPTNPLPALLSLLALLTTAVAAYVFWPEAGGRFWPDGQQATVAPRKPQSPPPAAAVQPPVPAAAPPAPTSVPAFGQAPAPPGDPPTAVTPAPPAPAATDPPPAPQPASPPPMPRPVDPEPPPGPDPRARARLAAVVEDALGAAYEAIRTDDFDTADRKVTAAARVAAADESLADRVTSWQQFARYARQAADYRERALNAANGGGDFDVGGQKIAVVESTPGRFVYRKAGRNVEVTPRSMVPGPVVTEILRRWFAADPQPGNDVFLGVHLVARREPNLNKADAAWERARRAGEDVSRLVPLLTDPIVRGVAGK